MAIGNEREVLVRTKLHKVELRFTSGMLLQIATRVVIRATTLFNLRCCETCNMPENVARIAQTNLAFVCGRARICQDHDFLFKEYDH